MSDEFFEAQLPPSKIKALIVSDYFLAWSRIIRGDLTKIGYLDFYSGPGKYGDGSDSTPLLILKHALKDPVLTKILVTFFNDLETEKIDKLKEHIYALPNIGTLKFQPMFRNLKVDKDVELELAKTKLIPTLVFIDPYGYKGLSLSFIGHAIKDWGCDCILFFNYNRINAAITNPAFTENINALFGKEVAENLRNVIPKIKPDKREEKIMETFAQCLQKVQGFYSIKFKFYQKHKCKTSHFLILITKNVKGYSLMKEVMHKFSDKIDNVASFEYNPVGRPTVINTLFGPSYDPIGKLGNQLLESFKGKTITMKEIYIANNIGKPYIAANYKSALLRLEDEGKIKTVPERSKRKPHLGKPSMGDNVVITFN